MNRIGYILFAATAALITTHAVLYWQKYGHKIYGDVVRLGTIVAVIAIISLLLAWLQRNTSNSARYQWLPNGMLITVSVFVMYLISCDLRPMTERERVFLHEERKSE